MLWGVARRIAWRSIARKYKRRVLGKTDCAERRKALVNCTWAIVMPIIILGGIRLGVFTPPEAAVVAAVYAFFVAKFIYKAMSWADCYRVLISTSSTTAIVMFLCGAATVAAYMITLADLPNQLADLFAPIMDKPLLFMALMVIFLDRKSTRLNSSH